MDQHRERLQDIVRQVRDNPEKLPVKIFHGSSNSTRVPNYSGRHVVDTSALNHVIEVNVAGQYVLVEPSVQMDELVDATLASGLVPPVVMEFPGISVGGGIQGGAAESSSFKHGLFHETAIEYEMVLGNGEVVTASRTENADLFWGAACSYGSLGIMTLVKLRLVPARPYVRLTYHRTVSYEDALQRIDTAMRSTGTAPDFIDGILYSPGLGVIMTGTLSDKTEDPEVTFSRPEDEWFYLHPQQVVKKHEVHTELIPLKDYLFRYDRGAFWVGRLGYAIAKIPFTRTTRRMLDRMMYTRRLYQWVHESDLSQRVFVQDIFMPSDTIGAFLPYVESKLNIWPLWLLPMQINREKQDIFGLSFSDAPYAVNVGIWGDTKARSFAEFKDINRSVEQSLVQYNAHKTLYAHSYYPRDEFWQMYDQAAYDRLRAKYHAADVFDNLYDKVTVTEAYKVPISQAMAKYIGRKIKKRLSRR